MNPSIDHALVEILREAYLDSIVNEPEESSFWIYKPESFERSGKILPTPWGAVGVFEDTVHGDNGRSVQPIRFEKTDFKKVFETLH